jgi:hypothetical protein
VPRSAPASPDVARITGIQLLRPWPPALLLGAWRAAAPQPVALLAVDADFGDAIPADERRLAEAVLRFRCRVLDAGGWVGPQASGPDAGFGVLVVGGLLSRTVTLEGRASPELFGPGDIVEGGPVGDAPDGGPVSWVAHQRSAVVVLDARFDQAGRRWPALWHVVVRRAASRAHRLALQLAAMQLSRVEDRVEHVLWQLADRWGRVTTEGVIVPVALTHQALGHLVGAKRPTVSLALATLDARGTVARRADGSWRLDPRPEDSRLRDVLDGFGAVTLPR